MDRFILCIRWFSLWGPFYVLFRVSWSCQSYRACMNEQAISMDSVEQWIKAKFCSRSVCPIIWKKLGYSSLLAKWTASFEIEWAHWRESLSIFLFYFPKFALSNVLWAMIGVNKGEDVSSDSNFGQRRPKFLLAHRPDGYYKQDMSTGIESGYLWNDCKDKCSNSPSASRNLLIQTWHGWVTNSIYRSDSCLTLRWIVELWLIEWYGGD